MPTDPYFAIAFGAMCLALAFSFLALPFGLWILYRHMTRVRKFQIEKTSDGRRWSAETENAEPSEYGLYWRLFRHPKEK